jgi:tetratricopeptide (TPR) repeat protein
VRANNLTPFAKQNVLRPEVYFYLSDAHFLRGEALTAPGPKMTCYQQQKDVALRAIELKQGRQDTIKNLGLAYLKLGELDEAERIFRDLIERYPTYEVAQYNLACVYAQRGAKFRLRCIAELTDLVTRDGEWRYIARIDPDLDPLWEDDLLQSLLFPRPRPEA